MSEMEQERVRLQAELAELTARSREYAQERAQRLRSVAQGLPRREVVTPGNITMREFLEQTAHEWDARPDAMMTEERGRIEKALDRIESELDARRNQ